MKVITFSRQFPAYHPKAGQPTFFVEKIASLLSVISPGWSMVSQFDALRKDPLLFDSGEYRRCQDNEIFKSHTIRKGNRWKEGEVFSARVWSDAPYRSKQIEFAQLKIERTWDIVLDLRYDKPIAHIDGLPAIDEMKTVAANDGLSYQDFIDWFAKPFPIEDAGIFRGQIICWNKDIHY